MSSLASKQGPRYRHIAGEEEPFETIAVEKLTPIIGAEISGVDIGKLVSDEAPSNRQMDEIHRALAENLVIFFRDQHLTPQQHLAFGRKFGELHVHPAAPHEGDDPALMHERMASVLDETIEEIHRLQGDAREGRRAAGRRNSRGRSRPAHHLRRPAVGQPAGAGARAAPHSGRGPPLAVQLRRRAARLPDGLPTCVQKAGCLR